MISTRLLVSTVVLNMVLDGVFGAARAACGSERQNSELLDGQLLVLVRAITGEASKL